MKKLKLFSASILLFIVVLIFSCRKEPSAITSIDYSILPVNIGHWVIYDVDSVVYSEIKDTAYHFQVKEVIESKYLDNSGRETYRIEKYKRLNDTLPWTLQKVIALNRNTANGERVEDNERIVILNFPVALHHSWNGYAYVGQGSVPEPPFEYTSINENVVIGSKTYENSVVVTRKDEENLIEKEYSVEKYSKDIGLIYKEFIKDSAATIVDSVPLQDRISGGLELKYKINSYGN